MSDRRPEKLYVIRLRAMNGPHDYREATVDEAVAAVRRGVESGKIEGEVRESIDGCIHVDGVPDGEFLIVHVGPPT